MRRATTARVRGASEIALYTPEPQPMPVAGPVLGAAVSKLLAERGIALHTTRPLASIDAGTHELVFADDARERFDLLAAVPPHRSPEAVRRSPLANESGWIPSMRARCAHGSTMCTPLAT